MPDHTARYSLATLSARTGIPKNDVKLLVATGAFDSHRSINPNGTHSGFNASVIQPLIDAYTSQHFSSVLTTAKSRGGAVAAEQSVLDYLVKTPSCALDTVADHFNLAPSRVREIIANLQARGHDITFSEETVSVLRTPLPQSFNVAPSWSGESTQKFLVSSDHHNLSWECRVESIKRMYAWGADHGCQFAINAGDIDHGSPHMHKGYEFELVTTAFDDHVDYIVEEHPADLTTLIIDGNHCLSWYKDNGASLVAAVCKRRPDIIRAGVREAFLPGPDGRANCVYICHPGDGKAYSKSYKPQKIAEWLHDCINDVAEDLDQRQLNIYPQLSFIGHYHSYCHIRGPYRSHMFTLPAMCGMTPFQRDKKLYNEVGFLIVEVTFDDHGLIVGDAPGLSRCAWWVGGGVSPACTQAHCGDDDGAMEREWRGGVIMFLSRDSMR